MLSRLKALLPGMGLALLLTVLAVGMERLETAYLHDTLLEALVAALFLGIAWRNLVGIRPAQAAGVDFSAREVLEFAVVLLGASVHLPSLFKQGFTLLLAITLAVALTLFLSFRLGLLLGLNRREATLVAVGNAICGNSAIAAVAPTLRATPDEVARAIAFTAVLGVVVVVGLPLLVPLLGFSHYQYGILAGLSVYAVPQVVAAAARVSDVSLQVATSVKLVRVMLLGPLVLGLSLREGKGNPQLKAGKLVPWFITGFLTLSVLRSSGLVSAELGKSLAGMGKQLTILAMAGLGLGVDLESVRRAGLRATLAVVGSLLILISLSILLIRLFNLGA